MGRRAPQPLCRLVGLNSVTQSLHLYTVHDEFEILADKANPSRQSKTKASLNTLKL